MPSKTSPAKKKPPVAALPPPPKAKTLEERAEIISVRLEKADPRVIDDLDISWIAHDAALIAE